LVAGVKASLELRAEALPGNEGLGPLEVWKSTPVFFRVFAMPAKVGAEADCTPLEG
jgi:hypothetical protein